MSWANGQVMWARRTSAIVEDEPPLTRRSSSSTTESETASSSAATSSSPIVIPSSYRRSIPSHHVQSPPKAQKSATSTGSDQSMRLLGTRPSLSPTTTPSFVPLSPPQIRSRRRSSLTSTSGGGGPGIGGTSPTPFGSLVGSYENSLLTGRMSALPSLPLPFICSIGVLGSANSPAALRCPKHLTLPFGAFYYTTPGEGAKASNPYVGTIDLENYYYSQVKQYATPRATAATAADPSIQTTTSGGEASDSSAKLPRFPGYRIPEQGRLQIVIKNANNTAIKLFLIPYDLAGLSREGKGGKTFLQQKSYTLVVDPTEPKVDTSSSSPSSPPKPSASQSETSATSSSSSSPTSKGRLRYAIHLQFCSPPATSPSSYKSRHHHTPPQYYLHGTIRVVFASSRALDYSEKLRVVSESPDLNRQISPGEERFASYRGPGEEWELARKKAKAREKAKEELRNFGLEGDGVGEIEDGGEEERGRLAREAFTFVPSPSPLSPARYLSTSPLRSQIPSPNRSSEGAKPFTIISKDRTLQPTRPSSKTRSSGLSRSRPPSPPPSPHSPNRSPSPEEGKCTIRSGR